MRVSVVKVTGNDKKYLFCDYMVSFYQFLFCFSNKKDKNWIKLEYEPGGVKSFMTSSRQHLVKFINNRSRPLPEQLPHFAPATMRVEGGEVKIIRLDMDA